MMHLRGGMQISDGTTSWQLTSRVTRAQSVAGSIDELDARVTKATKIRQDDLEEHTKQQKLEMLRTIARQQCRLQLRTHACQRHQGVTESKHDPKHEEFWKKVPVSRWCRRLQRVHRTKGIELHHAEEDLHKVAITTGQAKIDYIVTRACEGLTIRWFMSV